MVRHHVDGHVGEQPDKACGLSVLALNEGDRWESLPTTVLCVGGNRPRAEADVHAGTLPAVVRVHRRDLDQPGVDPRQVVVLHKVFADQLPVSVDVVLDAARQAVLVEAIPSELPDEVAELVLDRRRVGVEADEDETAPLCNPHRVQAHLSDIEGLDVGHVEGRALIDGHFALGRKQRRTEAGAIEVVGPGVVRAREEALDLARALTQPRATMATDVVVRAQLACLIARDDD